MYEAVGQQPTLIRGYRPLALLKRATALATAARRLRSKDTQSSSPRKKWCVLQRQLLRVSGGGLELGAQLHS